MTIVQDALAPGRAAPGGLVSPVSGMATLGRIRVGNTTNPVSFQVVHPFGVPGVFTGAGTSAAFTPAANAISSSALRLPVSVGDRIGVRIDASTRPDMLLFDPAGGSSYSTWFPPLDDGGPGRAPAPAVTYEIAINADIEPSNTVTLGATTRNQKKGTATLNLTLPNPGELTASGKGVRAAADGRATISKSVTAGPAQLLIKAKGRQSKKLNTTGTVKLNVKITYTPTNGAPGSQSVKVKLKKR